MFLETNPVIVETRPSHTARRAVSSSHISPPPFKDSRDWKLRNFLWREFGVQGWSFLFLNVSSPLDVFFSSNSPPAASATDDCWQRKPGLYIPSIGLQAYWFKNTLPSFSKSSLELCQNADIYALVFTGLEWSWPRADVCVRAAAAPHVRLFLSKDKLWSDCRWGLGKRKLCSWNLHIKWSKVMSSLSIILSY